ncbi:MAG: autotransporter domain-containing protein [Janthinobacterium lividum]
MTKIYQVIWNPVRQAMVVVSELARRRQAGSSGIVSVSAAVSRAACGTGRDHRVSTSAAPSTVLRALCAAVAMLLLGQTPGAWAACTPLVPTAGSTVNCTGPNLAFSSSVNNLTVDVAAGSVVSAPVGGPQASVTLSGNGASLSNAGAIGTLVGLPVTGVNIGNANGNVISINNTNTGLIQGLTDLLPTTLGSGIGFGVLVQNGVGGASTITNAGTINTNLLVLPAGAGAAIGATGGGAVSVVNTGTINGRIGIAANGTAGQGQSVINAGTITGSVAMGGGNNQFTSVTGSQISTPVPVAAVTLPGNGLTLAAGGVVDAGAGGNNTLVLQNSATGSGSGNTGTGVAAAGAYTNFEHLTVNSGTWTTDGALVSGDATLNGGIVAIDNGAALGAGTVTANGGALSAATQAAGAGLNVSNAITLANGGLTVNGANNLSLSGAIGGSGTLTTNATGSLTLDGANTYSGGTVLSAGTLALGSDTALGSGALNVTGAATLENDAAVTLGNAIDAAAALTLGGSADLTLNGAVTGAGSLTKQGAAVLTLDGANTYTGGTTLAAGGLVVGDGAALGTGDLTVTGAASLDSSADASLNNNIHAGADLDIGGSNALTLQGVVDGVGALSKNGAATLTLDGANTYSGGTNLAAGGITLGSNTALGSGLLDVTGPATLDSSADLVIANSVNTNDALTVVGSHGLEINGTVGGAGSLLKTGDASLTLTAANTYAGGTSLASGSLLIGNDASLGGGALHVTGDATLDSTADVSLANSVETDAALTVGGSHNMTLSGNFSGAGSVIKQGNAAISLDGDNTYAGGTTLQAGTLIAGGNSALGTGTLTVDGTATLVGSAAVDLNNAIALAAGGDLDIGGPNAITLNGTLSGDGALTKNSGSDLTLTGNNTFTGGLTLGDGPLTIGNAGALGTGTVHVIGAATLDNADAFSVNNAFLDDASLTLAGGHDLSLNGSISGAGNVTKAGPSALSLNGDNTYSGGTTLTSGTLVVGNNASLGSGALDVTGAATFDSTGDVALGNAINTAGPLTFEGSHSVEIDGTVTGTGSLVKNGGGNLTLTAANTYSAGTTLNAGTLQVNNNTALGTGRLTVTGDATLGNSLPVQLGNPIGLLNGSLTLPGQAPLDLTGPISGTGSLIKNGSAPLTLSGINTYSGGTILNEGAVTLGSASALGHGTLSVNQGATLEFNGFDETEDGLSGDGDTNLGGGATLTLNVSSDSAYSGYLTGSGGVVVAGTGTQVFIGMDTYTGGTNVIGNLQLGMDPSQQASGGGAGGSASPVPAAGSTLLAGSVAGDVTVGSSGTLSGNGSVGGNVSGAGKVVSGAPVITTNSNDSGTAIGAPTGLFSGALNIGGNYTQTPGSTLVVSVTPNSSTPLQVAGTATLGGNLSVIYGPGTYVGNSLPVLNATSVRGQFSQVTTTAAANVREDTPLARAINYRPNGVAIALLGEALPVVVAPTQTSIYSAAGTAIVLASQASNAMLLERLATPCPSAGRLQSARTSLVNPETCLDGRDKVWVSVLGDRLKVGSRNGQPGFQTHQYGFIAGAEQVLEQGTAGVSLGYANTSLGEEGTGSHASVDSLRAALYGVTSRGPVSLGATVGYAYDFLDAKRPFGAVGEASGSHGGQEFSAGLQAGLPMALGNGLSLTPRAGLRYAYFHGNDYQESGADGQDLRVGTDNARSLQPYVGMALEQNLGLSWRPIGLRFTLDYAREVLDSSHALGVSALDGTVFTAAGAPVSRGRLSAGVGLGVHVSPRLSLEAGYDMLINTGNLSGNAARVGLSYLF